MMRLLGSVLVLGATLWFGAYFAAKEKYRFAGAGRAGTRNPASAKPDCLPFRSSDRGSGKHQLEGGGRDWRDFRAGGGSHGREGKGFCGGNLDRGMVEAAESDFPDGGGFGYGAFLRENPRLSGKAQQEGSICLLLRYLEEALAQGRKRLEKNGRLYYGIGGLSGLLIIVTLL